MSRKTMSLACVVALAALALIVPSCNQAILTAPQGSTIQLVANPPTISAYGGVSVISALVIVQPAGILVPDGTVVQFFTNLGQIAPQAKTNDGVARVNLVADSRSGQATVWAFSGGGTATAAASPSASPGSSTAGSGVNSATTMVSIGMLNAKTILLTANPPRILPPGRTSQIVATVYDTNGNPLPNVPVTFTVDENDLTQPAYREYMSSQGNPIFTDNNGRAYDQLNTNRPVALGQRIVTITAVAPIAGTSTTSGSGTTGFLSQTLQVQIY
jgi:hypothetical protein